MTMHHFSLSLQLTKNNTMGRIRNRDLYPLQLPVDFDDTLLGTESETGYTKNFKVIDLTQFVLSYLGIDDMSFKILSVGSLVQETNVLTFTEVVWVYMGEVFTISSQVFNIPAAPDGYYRVDSIVVTSGGQLQIVSGTSSQENSTPPLIPNNALRLTDVYVFGSDIEPEAPPINGVMLKVDEYQHPFNNSGLLDSLEWNNENTYRWTSKVGLPLVLNSLFVNSEDLDTLYDGRLFTLINAGDDVLTLNHLGDAVVTDSQVIQFYLQSGTSLELPQRHIAVFKYSYSSQCLELVSTSRSVSEASQVFYNNPTYTNVQEALDALLYVPPAVSNFTNSIGTVERGSTVNSVVLNWSLNKVMTSQSLNNGIGTISPSLLTYTHLGQSIVSNRTYTITVGDDVNTATASTTVSFLNRRFAGISPNTSLTNAQVLALATSELSGSRVQTRNINGSGQYIHIAYPASYGAATFTVNGLEFTAVTLNIQDVTNSSGFTESYRIYRTNTIQNGSLLINIT